ncbi:MAG: hypothetical protein SFX18_11445 [Pirellulales bacterium]|nr:hypothetical protein [Pirellulales bacterium]
MLPANQPQSSLVVVEFGICPTDLGLLAIRELMEVTILISTLAFSFIFLIFQVVYPPYLMLFIVIVLAGIFLNRYLSQPKRLSFRFVQDNKYLAISGCCPQFLDSVESYLRLPHEQRLTGHTTLVEEAARLTRAGDKIAIMGSDLICQPGVVLPARCAQCDQQLARDENLNQKVFGFTLNPVERWICFCLLLLNSILGLLVFGFISKYKSRLPYPRIEYWLCRAHNNLTSHAATWEYLGYLLVGFFQFPFLIIMLRELTEKKTTNLPWIILISNFVAVGTIMLIAYYWETLKPSERPSTSNADTIIIHNCHPDFLARIESELTQKQ